MNSETLGIFALFSGTIGFGMAYMGEGHIESVGLFLCIIGGISFTVGLFSIGD